MEPKSDTSHRGLADFPVPRTRYLRFFELWTLGDWVLKAYLHSAHRDGLPRAFVSGAKSHVERELPHAEATRPRHRVGFVILSHGAVSNWIMLDWWSTLHLYQRIYQAVGMPPERFVEAPPGLFQCVYDLRITAFESEAWRQHVVENAGRDVQAYLGARLSIATG
jgi:hypothetical protein